jgi:hypothetical protein
MICPVIILVLSLALFMAMSGLYFLSYVRREGLGWLSRTVGFVTVGFGIAVFIGGITAALLKRNHDYCGKHLCKGNMEHSCPSKDHCSRERIDRNVRVYRYTTKGDSIKGDKTVVRKEVEVIKE